MLSSVEHEKDLQPRCLVGNSKRPIFSWRRSFELDGGGNMIESEH